MSYEPRLDDDAALGLGEECPECGNNHDDCEECYSDGTPDRMWGDEDE
jgi:hypothetical protein